MNSTSLAESIRVAENIDVGQNDVLLLTGSTVLPFPVASDDVDVVLITSNDAVLEKNSSCRHPERLSEQLSNGFIMSYQEVLGRELDLEVWPLSRVEDAIKELSTGICDVDSIESDFTRVGGLEVKVGADLFHALRVGVPISGAAELSKIEENIDWRSYFARRRDRHLVNVRDARKGIRSSLRAERHDEAYLKLTWAADSAMDGLIHHAGHSINRWKWRLRYLDMLTEQGAVDEDPVNWYKLVRFGSNSIAEYDFGPHLDMLDELWSLAGTPPKEWR